jgi:hypothetical protein
MRLLLLACICLLPLTGCIDESREVVKTQVSPWPEQGAPDALLVLADDLAACQAATAGLPAALAQLDRSGVASGGPYAAQTYVYHPTGIGVLRDGWRVLVADDRVRKIDHVWCIVRPPVRVNGSPSLRVVLIPMIELREAAAAAGGR